MSELLPCPFCGDGSPDVKDGYPLALVICEKCGCRAVAHNRYEASVKWNRRSSPGVPEGYVMAPDEPDEEMIKAAKLRVPHCCELDFIVAYDAMLSVARRK